MTRPNDATRKSQTHFEQIPLDVVKKIAKEDVPKDQEPTSRKSKAQSIPIRALHRNGR